MSELLKWLLLVGLLLFGLLGTIDYKSPKPPEPKCYRALPESLYRPC